MCIDISVSLESMALLKGQQTKFYFKPNLNNRIDHSFVSGNTFQTDVFAGLSSKRNIVLRLYYIDNLVVDDTFTSRVKVDMETAKQQGWTVVLRFAYVDCHHCDYEHMVHCVFVFVLFLVLVFVRATLSCRLLCTCIYLK